MSSLLVPLLAAASISVPPLLGRAAPPPDELGCARAKTALHRPAPALPTSPLVSPEDTDLLHYALDLAVDVPGHALAGTNTMTVRSLVDGLAEFHFRLDDVLTIDAVTVNGASAAWQRLDASTVRVTLAPPVAFDAAFDLAIAYHGQPSGGGFGSIVFRTRNGAPEAWTLSEPWLASSWWPVKEDNTDKSTADLWFTVRSDLVAASNGVLDGVDVLPNNQRRYRWRTEYPTVDYLYCFAITNYEEFGAEWANDGVVMPLRFYIYPENNSASNRNAWLLNLDMLDVFSARYGLYPFADEKYGMCQVGFGGGMEHQTMTSQGGFWESVTAHELAHQWWGDMITCATWHDIWLNEGFATWSEAVWFGDRPGASSTAYHDWMEARRPSSVGDSVYVYDASDIGRIFSGNFTYRKGGWVVHMLRGVLGEDAFWNALAAYRLAYAYDSATTDDLRDVLEAATGRDLGWFFDEWVYDIGAPAYRSAWTEHLVDGRRFVELLLEQVQDASYPVFAMPIDVGMNGGMHATVWNDARIEHLLFEVPADVTTLAVDPDDWVLITAKTARSFVPGPPKIVAVAPAPGALLRSRDVAAATAVFHVDVAVGAGDVELVGDAAGPVPCAFDYDAATHAATLTPLLPLAPDAYALVVHDAVVELAAGKALDGEVADPEDALALPSGDGLPGGDALVRFVVLADGDANADGSVDLADLLAVLAAWGPCPGCPADLDGDGQVDLSDLLLVLSSWGA